MGVGGCADDIRPTVRQSVVLREMKLYDMPAGLFHLFFLYVIGIASLEHNCGFPSVGILAFSIGNAVEEARDSSVGFFQIILK